MPRVKSIAALMSIAANEHDLEWLKEALQAAIKLELSTIPPYLCARWSVKSTSDPVAQTLREIVREEMLHLGLACNLLTSVGGVPQFNTAEAVPTYPGPMPGGVQPNVQVVLQGLSPPAVKLFMQIEFPEGGPIAMAIAPSEEYASIGEFYDAIWKAFQSLSPTLSQARQMQGALGMWVMGSLVDVERAINLIKHQGEGSQNSPEGAGAGKFAHYYRFKEIDTGRKLRLNPLTNAWEFSGDPVPLPDVWPMGIVPAGGYRQADVAPDVWSLLDQFDLLFTTLLNQLQMAWQNGSDGALDDSIDTMRQLRTPALSLMQIPIPGNQQTYGPCFRLKTVSMARGGHQRLARETARCNPASPLFAARS